MLRAVLITLLAFAYSLGSVCPAYALTEKERAVALYKKGERLIGEGRLTEAKALCEEGTKLDPRSYLMLICCGTLLCGMKQQSKGFQCLERAFKLEPKNIDNLFWRADMYMDKKNYADALASLELFVSKPPDRTVEYPNRTVAYTRICRAVAALKGAPYVVSYMSKHIESPDEKDRIAALGGLADYEVETKDFVKGSEYFRDLLKLDPNNDAALRGLGTCCSEQGKFAEAIKCLKGLPFAQQRQSLKHL